MKAEKAWQEMFIIRSALNNSYSRLETHMNTLQSNHESPEKTIIKKDALENLSEEAKYVIEICLNVPSELLKIITTPITKKVSFGKLKRFLNSKFNDKKKTEKVIKEIKEYVSEL